MTGPDFVDQIVKQLPVKEAYTDIVSPAGKEAGGLLADIVKTVRLALFPLQFTAEAQDRVRRFIHDAVNRVPREKLVSPPPQIIGPVLEGVRYETEGTPIDEMFSELLSASMDADRSKYAHPAMPSVIKQLSSDEAHILNSIAAAAGFYNQVQKFEILASGLVRSKLESSDLPPDQLRFPENVPMYVEHLEKLGLTRLDALKPMEPISDAIGRQIGGRNFLVYKLTAFGIAMMNACGKPPKMKH